MFYDHSCCFCLFLLFCMILVVLCFISRHFNGSGRFCFVLVSRVCFDRVIAAISCLLLWCPFGCLAMLYVRFPTHPMCVVPLLAFLLACLFICVVFCMFFILIFCSSFMVIAFLISFLTNELIFVCVVPLLFVMFVPPSYHQHCFLS